MDLTAKQFAPERIDESRRTPNDVLLTPYVDQRWEYMHPPFAWEVKNGQWLPLLSQLPLLPGVNNLNLDDAGDDPENVRALFRRKGCAIIAPADPRLGPYKNYMAVLPAYNAQNGAVGKAWMSMWDVPVMVANRVVWERDWTSYDAFRAHLVSSGICVINATVAKMVIIAKEDRLKQYESIPVGNITHSRQATMALLESEIKLMKDNMPGLAAPVPAVQHNKRRFQAERVTE